ncbi:Hypothetical protein R9X50_00283700 [Acrodontium crateriforme]|uniref:Uncharacterized protein n=1 Tax=Acrodontium crateriforme TaxID=150365 RepID=A0AAQ3R700_9PEZI|nr:Hypothetical protein R9X50_00283700 [Acrodontium crateriforme]
METVFPTKDTMLDKTSATTSYEPVDKSAIAEDGARKARMSGRFSDVFLNALLLIVPMLLFSGALLGLVFTYRVNHHEPLHSNLEIFGETNENGVYYVDFPATRLIFISSWSSSLAPMLGASMLALWSYPVARKVFASRNREDKTSLPTPYQLALVVNMLTTSGLRSLWQWIKYRLGMGWQSKRQSQSQALHSVAAVLAIATCLGFLVFAADTWLHLTTKSIEFIQTQPLLPPPDYSFRLMENCTYGNNSIMYQEFIAPVQGRGGCTIGVADPAQIAAGGQQTILLDGSEAVMVLNNVSDFIMVSTYVDGDGQPYSYLTIPPSPERAATDFTADTYAMRTQCTPISTECDLRAVSQISTPYSCSPGFHGDLYNETWNMAYSSNSSLDGDRSVWGVQNPYYWGLAAAVNLVGGGTILQANDPEIVRRGAGGTAFVLNCSTTLIDLYYESVNGTITRFWPSSSNMSVANIAQSTAQWTDFMEPYLQTAASFATLSSSAQELADKIALAYSKAALSNFAPAVLPAPAEVAQSRTTSLVTRIPAAPLYTLVIANLLFVGAGILLLVIALSASGGETRDIQARLSIVGIVADRFESDLEPKAANTMEEIFEEDIGEKDLRVSFRRSHHGGYVLSTMEANGLARE